LITYGINEKSIENGINDNVSLSFLCKSVIAKNVVSGGNNLKNKEMGMLI
jgi:hypothetical protein